MKICQHTVHRVPEQLQPLGLDAYEACVVMSKLPVLGHFCVDPHDPGCTWAGCECECHR